MAEITLIEPQKKDKTRCNVYVDGRFYCGIKLEIAVKYRLKAGMQIEEGRLDEIQLATEKAQALDKAMTHISATMKTKKQIRDFLIRKGYTSAVCDYVLEKMEQLKLADDCEYCRAYVNSVSGKGKRALEADLIKRGAERAAIEKALADKEDDADEALRVIEKYLRGKENTKENVYKGMKYLLSKGYSYDTAKQAAEKLGGGYEDY